MINSASLVSNFLQLGFDPPSQQHHQGHISWSQQFEVCSTYFRIFVFLIKWQIEVPPLFGMCKFRCVRPEDIRWSVMFRNESKSDSKQSGMNTCSSRLSVFFAWGCKVNNNRSASSHEWMNCKISCVMFEEVRFWVAISESAKWDFSICESVVDECCWLDKSNKMNTKNKGRYVIYTKNRQYLKSKNEQFFSGGSIKSSLDASCFGLIADFSQPKISRTLAELSHGSNHLAVRNRQPLNFNFANSKICIAFLEKLSQLYWKTYIWTARHIRYKNANPCKKELDLKARTIGARWGKNSFHFPPPQRRPEQWYLFMNLKVNKDMMAGGGARWWWRLRPSVLKEGDQFNLGRRDKAAEP